jgi:hypothetical protein
VPAQCFVALWASQEAIFTYLTASALVAARVANMPQGARTDLEPSLNLGNGLSQEQAAIVTQHVLTVVAIRSL